MKKDIHTRLPRFKQPLPKGARPDEDSQVEVVLKCVQNELMPERARDIVAINTETGEYVVGKDFGEACDGFRERWPHGPLYVCQVDGGPALRM